MKKLFSALLLLMFLFTLFSSAEAVVKKKKKPLKRRRHYRRIIRNWPKGGPRPVFPKAGDETALPPQPIVLTTVETVAVIARPSLEAPARDFFFAEGGLGGGGVAAEIGYQRTMNEKISLSGAGGFVAGGDGGVVLDLVRATYDLNNMFAGAGINCARNMFGLELFAGKKFNRWSARVGYSGILGVRAAAGYEF